MTQQSASSKWNYDFRPNIMTMKKINNIFYKLVALAAMLLACSGAWATTYYIDGRGFSEFAKSWVQNKNGGDGNIETSTPETGVISFDIELGDDLSQNEHILQFEVVWANSGRVRVSYITASQIGNYNCIKIINGNVEITQQNDGLTQAINGGYVQLTNYGGGGGTVDYFALGSLASVFGAAWCDNGSCPENNALTLSGNYYTRKYTKVENQVSFRLHDSDGYMANSYDDNPPTQLNDVATYAAVGDGYGGTNMQLTGAKNSSGQNKQTSFDMTIKYDATNNKTYLITTPYIFLKGAFVGPSSYGYGNSAFDWTDISKDGDNWVFTFNWTLTSDNISDKTFTICTTTSETDGFKLPNFTDGITLDASVERYQNNSVYYYRPTISVSAGDKMSLIVTRYGPESYKVQLVNLSRSVPVVRIGKKLTEVTEAGESQGNVRVSGYIASRGNCTNVNSITIYYANNGSFRTGDEYKSASTTISGLAINSNNTLTQDFYLTKAQVASVVGKGETLYVRLKATNTGFESAYSDVAKLEYQYDKFVAVDKAINPATACPGEHEFQWTGENGMFNPAPTGFTVRLNNAEGKLLPAAMFKIVGDKMVWDDLTGYDEDSEGRVCTFYFTASKEGYTPTSATATFTLTAVAPEEDVTVTVSYGGSPVSGTIIAEPWEAKTFAATRSDGGSGIVWTNPDNSTLTVSGNGASATFKGKEAGKSYEITARAANASCGKSDVTTVNIEVSVIEQTCKDN